MADPPPASQAGPDAGAGPDGAPPSGVPRWVKVSGPLVLVLVLALVGLHLGGGGLAGH